MPEDFRPFLPLLEISSDERIYKNSTTTVRHSQFSNRAAEATLHLNVAAIVDDILDRAARHAAHVEHIPIKGAVRDDDNLALGPCAEPRKNAERARLASDPRSADSRCAWRATWLPCFRSYDAQSSS